MNINEIKNIITENTLLRRQTQTLCPHEGQEARWLVQGIAGRSVRFFLEAGVLTTEGCDGKDGKVWTSTMASTPRR